jgi:hypothetical protein
MSYFQPFPSITYSLDNENQQFKQVKNIFARVKLLKEVLDNADMFYTYEMKESDTPEIIAHKLYGSAHRYWMVLFANEVIDPYYGVPLKYQSFDNFIISKYGSIENAQDTIAVYRKKTTVTTNKNGLINSQTYTTELTDMYYDYATGSIVTIEFMPDISNPIISVSSNTVTIADYDGIDISITTAVEYLAITSYDYEVEQNESKRTIKILKPEYVGLIENEFDQLFKN